MIFSIFQIFWQFISYLFVLLVIHAILDFPLQGDTVALNKNPLANTELQKSIPWWYWMLSHALSHGGGVWLITQSVFLGMAEAVCHFIIDYFKCKKKYDIHGDQILHLSCKVLWVILFFGFVFTGLK